MTADVHTLAGAYVIDALPRDERAFFERHLATCSACQREVAELRPTAAALAAAFAEPPPVSLRDRVLSRAQVTPQLPREADPAGSPSALRRLRPLLAVAAAVVVIVAGALSVVAVQVADRLSEVEAELARVQAGSEATDELIAVLTEPDSQVAALDAPAGATARLVYSQAANRAVFLTDGLPSVPEERTYQLWVVRDGVPEPDRLFRPGQDGQVLVAMDRPIRDAEMVAVTIEPRGGSTEPTGDILMSGKTDA